jgi:hypothetical protein
MERELENISVTDAKISDATIIAGSLTQVMVNEYNKLSESIADLLKDLPNELASAILTEAKNAYWRRQE